MLTQCGRTDTTRRSAAVAEGLVRMSMCQCDVPPMTWELPFVAVPEHVARLRRIVVTPLRLWGVSNLVAVVQLCLTELITNVITHVGAKTPVWIALSLHGTRVRVEVRDPDRQGFPVLRQATSAQETGRGLRLVDAVADRWGVTPNDHGKTIWCELPIGPTPTAGRCDSGPRVSPAEALLTLNRRTPVVGGSSSLLGHAVAEGAVAGLIADLLHWCQIHGDDLKTLLRHARARLTAQVERT
ncbi:ATP-binding protein [Streptomyces alboverticillatus]|uniref:ATP-binding protein n=2 Tax=Streptomyces TaxID=1883 RepID=UPI000A36CE96